MDLFLVFSTTTRQKKGSFCYSIDFSADLHLWTAYSHEIKDIMKNLCSGFYNWFD